MSGWIRFFFSAAFAVCGMAAFVFAAVGSCRFCHVMYRMHSTAIADTVGILCLTLSAVVYLGVSFVSAKELAVAVMMLFTSPVSTHMLAEIEYHKGNYASGVGHGKGGGRDDG